MSGVELEVESTEEAPVAETPTETVWYEGMELSESQIGHIQNKGWGSPADVLKSYEELEKFRGADEDSLLKIPKDGDKDAWDAFHQKLGRPKTADEYVLGGDDIESEDLDFFKKELFELGVSSDKATDFMNRMLERTKELGLADDESSTLSKKKELAELKGEWGPDYDKKVELANRVLRQSGLEQEDLETLRETLGFTKTVRIMANIGERIGQDTILNGGGDVPDFNKTVEQYVREKKELMTAVGADPNRHALWNEGKGPDKEKLDSLITIINNLRNGN